MIRTREKQTWRRWMQTKQPQQSDDGRPNSQQRQRKGSEQDDGEQLHHQYDLLTLEHQTSGSSTAPSLLSAPLPSHSPHPMLTISPHKLRPIVDPVTNLLNQLHKLIYISQLPPATKRDIKRERINKYKKALFSQPHMFVNLKQEIQSLLAATPSHIQPNLGIVGLNFSSSNSSSSSTSDSAPLRAPDLFPYRMTHEELHNAIEQTLTENGYYQRNPQQSTEQWQTTTPSAQQLSTPHHNYPSTANPYSNNQIATPNTDNSKQQQQVARTLFTANTPRKLTK